MVPREKSDVKTTSCDAKSASESIAHARLKDVTALGAMNILIRPIIPVLLNLNNAAIGRSITGINTSLVVQPIAIARIF